MDAGVYDLESFGNSCSQVAEEVTALRDRITLEIVVHLLVLIGFIKDPSYSGEREIRLMLNSNDGTLNAANVEDYKRGNESIPFTFLDLRSKNTGRLPLAEIRLGPKASFPEEKAFLESFLDDLGYGSSHEDRPRVIGSALSTRPAP